jgi:hypothetical protein
MGWKDDAIVSPAVAAWQKDEVVATPKATPPAPATSGERGVAALSGVNRGIAGVAGLPGDTAENLVNLGIAGYGAVKQAITGKPGPDLVNLPATSRWIADRWQQGGVPTENPRPDDRASRMLHTGGVVAGSSMGGRPVPTALSATAAAVAQETLGDEYAAPAALAAGSFAHSIQTARAKSLVTQQTTNAQRDKAALEARKAGYVLPPSQANPSVWNKMLEGFAGKISTAQHASSKNQHITNVLARRSLGLPDDAPLSDRVLNSLRNDAGKAYQSIKDFGGGKVKFRPDAQFKADIDSIGGDFAKAAKEFPELAQVKDVETLKAALQRPISPAAAVELVKKLRKDASVNFKAFDNNEKLATAKAQRAAADAIEDLVERNLTRGGNGDLVKNFREARVTIARTYDIEAALNDTTGNVSAKAFAKLASKGKPLGPNEQKIASFAEAFPKAAQTPEQMGSVPGLSPLDYIVGGAGFAVDPTLGALAAARPVARYGMLTDSYQDFLRPSYRTPVESIPSVLLRPNVLLNRR